MIFYFKKCFVFGKGFGVLFDNVVMDIIIFVLFVLNGGVVFILIEVIEVNLFNLWINFEKEVFCEFLEFIVIYGIIQLLIVWKFGCDKYQLIFGECCFCVL